MEATATATVTKTETRTKHWRAHAVDNPGIVHLRIKRKRMAAEARIIRAQERVTKRKTKGESPLVSTLQDYRRGGLRRHARIEHLVHAFMTGRPYAEVEEKVAEPTTALTSILPAVVDHIDWWLWVRKNAWDGPTVDEWMDDAKKHLDAQRKAMEQAAKARSAE